MSAGTPVRAVVAATSQAYVTIRRLARPWVMIDRPAHAEERRATDLLVVEDAPDPADAGPHEQVGEPAAERPLELVAPQVEDVAGQALEELDHDVAEDRVADHHVGQVAGQVLALDVALEAQPGCVEQLGRALDPGVALALLLADRQQCHARPGDAQDALGEDRAHLGVLDEVLRGRIRVGADVEQDHRAGRGDHLHRQRGAVDAGQPPEAQDGRGHARPGMAGGHDRVGFAALDEVDRDDDRGVLLLAQGERGMLVHADDLAGLDDRHVGRQARRRSSG